MKREFSGLKYLGTRVLILNRQFNSIACAPHIIALNRSPKIHIFLLCEWAGKKHKEGNEKDQDWGTWVT